MLVRPGNHSPDDVGATDASRQLAGAVAITAPGRDSATSRGPLRRLRLGGRIMTRRLREHLRVRLVAYVVLLGSLLLTGLAWYYITEYVETLEYAQFYETSQRMQRITERRLTTYIDAMYGGAGLFAASETVTREEWRAYTERLDLARRYPGIQGFGFAERIAAADTATHTTQLRAQGFPNYTLHSDGESDTYFPLIYVEPFDQRNQRLFGYDLHGEPEYRAAMEQARDTGLPHASKKVLLDAQPGADKQAHFVIYLPIYQNGAPVGTVDERRAALRGFIVTVFQTKELLEGILGAQHTPTIDYEVFDGTELTPEHLLYENDNALLVNPSKPRETYTRTETFEVAGRIWTLRITAARGFEPDLPSSLASLVLASGVAVSLLLFGITWLLASSRLLAERTSIELAASNAELEAFSYSVSHDLRAPLRALDGFSQALLDDYAPQLAPTAQDYLHRVRAASQRMGHLIDGLLDLARVSRTPLNHEPVDLTALAQAIIADLAASDPQHAVTVTIAPDLRAIGDPRLLRVLLENLLSNAWKFSQPVPQPQIEVGRQPGPGSPVFYVTDNGVGFDPAYADQLFVPFQRLHPAGQFEGSGIGLATVQRIVRRHGGRVWATSAVDHGTTFFFTLGDTG